MSVLRRIFDAFSIPILVLNIFGHIIGAIWLFILGEWRVVIFGWLTGIAFYFVYPIVIGLIQMPFTAVMSSQKRFNPLVSITGFVNMFLVHMINLFCVLFVIRALHSLSEGQNVIPFLLLGWGIIVSPFQFMASNEDPDSLGSLAAAALVSISYIVIAVLSVFGLFFVSLIPVLLFTIIVEIILLEYTSSTSRRY